MSTLTKAKQNKNKAADPVIQEVVTETVIENAIILRPIKMDVGSIETNMEAVLSAVKEKSAQYQDVTKYEGDDKKAKADRAMLRKQKELTKTTIASIQEAYNKPLEEFLAGGKQILHQFDLAISRIDEFIKQGESLQKEKKYEKIQNFYNSKNFDLVSLDMIFDQRWLNKGYDIQDIKFEINNKIADIHSNIKMLENIAEHGMAAKAFYLETLDVSAAMRRVETLKANAERLAREKMERETREVQAQVARNAALEYQEVREEKKEAQVKYLVGEALDIDPEIEEKKNPEIISFVCEFFGTKEQLLALRQYMTAHGISYIKLGNGNYE